MLPIELNNETLLADWWFTIGCLIFLIASVIGVLDFIIHDDGDLDGVAVGVFSGLIVGIFWPFFMVGGIGWGLLEGSQYLVHRPPRAVRLERAKVQRDKDRQEAIRELEQELDLLPSVEVSASTIQALRKARQNPGTRRTRT